MPVGPSREHRERLPQALTAGLVVLAGYAALTLVMTWPIVNVRHLASASYGGDTRLVIWILGWDDHAILTGHSLFDANMFYPAAASLQYSEHMLGLSLFTLPIYALTHNPVLAYNLVWLLAFVLNGAAMHALVVHYTGRHVAGLVAGVIFAFSFYTMQQAPGHLQMLWMWLVPMSLLLFERWMAQPSIPRAALWGAAVLLQVLASWYVAVMVLLANALVVAWRFAMAPRGRWTARLGTIAAIAGVSAAIVYPFARHYAGLEVPWAQESASNSADWASYFVPPLNTIVGRWWTSHISGTPRWIWGEQTLFLGWIASAIGAAGVVAMCQSRAWRRVGVYAGIAALGFALSFGPHPTPRSAARLFDLFAKLPGFSGIRAPGRFGVLVLLGLSVIAGTAVAAAEQRRARATRIAVACLLPLMLLEWFVVDFPNGRPQPQEIPPIYLNAELARAHAYVSLPTFHATDHWFKIPDYLLFSTATWAPIANGYGRSEPPNYVHEVGHLEAFPGVNGARTLRQLGIDHVVLRSAEYPDGAAAILAEAKTSADYTLVDQQGTDYLFRVNQR
jgi:hypothetical protein